MNVLVTLAVAATVLITQGIAKCPRLANTDGMFSVNVSWTYDEFSSVCTARVAGSDEETSWSFGQESSLTSIANHCLSFRCAGSNGLSLSATSSCSYRSGCSEAPKNGSAKCREEYRCVSGVQAMIDQPIKYGLFDRYQAGWLLVFTGYTCGHTGSALCDQNECFNPHADPAQESVCLAKGADYIDVASLRKYRCQRFTTCDNKGYVDLVHEETGCQFNGNYVAPGEVTWSDPCRHTICVISDGKGELRTSFKGYAGCVHGEQCVKVGKTMNSWQHQQCVKVTCRHDPAQEEPYHLTQEPTGCYLNGSCYAEDQQVPVDDCKHFLCRINARKQFAWGHRYTGCYNPNTKSCVKHGSKYMVGDCIENKCDVFNYGKWETTYKLTNACRPSKGKCKKGKKDGCKHNGQCYPVNSVIRMDMCTQFVCFSDQNKPYWKPHSTGCYGPLGCMKFGQQYLDPYSLNTYRCTYQLAALKLKYTEFHRSCVAPNGTTLALGTSVLIGDNWHSCYRFGKMKVPVSRATKPPTEKTCGKVEDTNDWWYTKVWYYTPVARCKKVGVYCTLTCEYFDEPCTQTDLTPWRYIGDKFLLGDSQCVCTQERKVNNKVIPASGSLFNTPSLCGEDGVRNAACQGPGESSVYQWGELWQKSGSKPVQVCTCHPLERKAFCSRSLSSVVDVLEDTEIAQAES